MEKLSLHVNPGKVLHALLLAVTVSAPVVQASVLGGSSGAFLRYPVSAPALAMGGAFSAAPSSAIPWWNPAALAWEKTRTLAAGAGFRSLGQTDGYASFTFRVPPRVGMGLFFLYRGDPFLNNLYDENENQLDNAAYTSFTGKIALSYYITRKLSAGFSYAVSYQQLPSGYIGSSISYTSQPSPGGLDIALSYRWSNRLTLTAQLRDAGARFNWSFTADGDNLLGFGAQNDDRVIPTLLVGSSYEGKLLNRPFIWNMDLRGNVLSGDWEKIDRPSATLSNGWEWRYWEKAYLRLGIGDLEFNGDITADSDYYWRNFSLRLTGGAAVDLSFIRKNMWCHYAFSTDKVWAGIDQQIGITYTF